MAGTDGLKGERLTNAQFKEKYGVDQPTRHHPGLAQHVADPNSNRTRIRLGLAAPGAGAARREGPFATTYKPKIARGAPVAGTGKPKGE